MRLTLIIAVKKKYKWALDLAVLAYNPSIWEVKVGGSQVLGQSRLPSGILSQNQNKQVNRQKWLMSNCSWWGTTRIPNAVKQSLLFKDVSWELRVFRQRTSKGTARSFLVFWVLVENICLRLVTQNYKLENSDLSDYFTKWEHECSPVYVKYSTSLFIRDIHIENTQGNITPAMVGFMELITTGIAQQWTVVTFKLHQWK